MGDKQEYVHWPTKDADIEKGSSKSLLTNKSARSHCRLRWKFCCTLVVAFICIVSCSTPGFIAFLKSLYGSDTKRLEDVEIKVDGHDNQIRSISLTVENNDKNIATDLSEIREKLENNSEEQKTMNTAIEETKKELQALSSSTKTNVSRLGDELKSQSQKSENLQEKTDSLAKKQEDISKNISTWQSKYNTLKELVRSLSEQFSRNSSAQNKASLLILLICIVIRKILVL